MSETPDGTITALHEKSREYRFTGRNIKLENVVELIVRPSGTHRLKTTDGHLHIISTGWLAVEIVDDGEWTV